MSRIRMSWIVLAALLAGCDGGTEPQVPDLRVEDAVLEARGDTTTLAALSEGAVVAAEWESLDPAIVTVTKGGLATAVAAGDARVRASFGGVLETGTVTVLPAVDVRVSDLAVVTDPSGDQGMRMRIRNDGGRGFYTLEFWNHALDGSKRRILWYATETEAEPGLDVDHRNFLGDEVAEWVVAYSREPLAAEPVRTSCARLDGEAEPCPSDLPDPPAAVDSVVVSPAAAVLSVGDSVQYTARAFAGGQEVFDREVAWSTPSSNVISLSATGMAVALQAGYGQVDATVEGTTSGVALTVTSDSGTRLVVAPITLPTATQGRDYAAQLVATGGDGAYAWSLQSGALPAGVALTGGGALVGAPTDSGSFPFTARVTDGGGQAAMRSLTLAVDPAPTIQSSSLPPAELGATYAAQLMASGGTGAYAWSVTEGALPDGLALAPDGAIAGTPTTLGSSTFTVRVTDEASASHSRAFTIVVGEVGELANGTPLTGLEGGTGSVRYYSIEVPATATLLTFNISGGTGDVDLYVRHGALPMEYTYDCRPLRSGNEETCTFNAPDAGRWFIMLRAHATYAGVTLVATHDG